MPLKLTRKKGSPNWYMRGSIRGLIIEESTRTGDVRTAQDLLALRTAELLQRSVYGNPSTRTLAEAALSYMQAGGERHHLPPLLRHFAKTKLADIDQAAVEKAALKLMKPGCAPATVHRQVIAPVSMVMHHAARLKWCQKPVFARRKEPKGRVRWISHEEADQLIEAASPHLKPLVIFLLSTGARLSEALYLDWRDVDLTAGQVVFVDTKNGDRRGVPLPARCVAALANLPHLRGAVFRRPVGRAQDPRKANAPIGYAYARNKGGGGQVKVAWKGMCSRAGITNFTPHDCRHTWATWHYRANKDILQLMELGGWKSERMVMRYTHQNTSHLAAGQQRIWENPGKPVQPANAKRLRSNA